LTLQTIFPDLLYVSKWWKDIIYNSFQNLVISHVENYVFFGHTPINVDVIPEFVQFVSLFKSIQTITLSRIAELEDSDLDVILESCPLLESITLNNCDLLSAPKIKLFQSHNNQITNVTKISLPYCASLTYIQFVETLNERLHTLVLTGTPLNDSQLVGLVISRLKHLHCLDLSSMKNLVSPNITSESIRSLSLRHCTQLTNPIIDCPHIRELNLGRTRITDESLRIGVFETRSCLNLEKLWLDMCDMLRSVNVGQRQAQIGNDQGMILAKLTYLNVEACTQLEQVLTSENLRTLKIRLCRNLQNVAITDLIEVIKDL
jgi:hypothetical protein